jgi:tRNA A37 N6-isopentenylltransferase MiaA
VAPSDRQRIARGLEVFRATGPTCSTSIDVKIGVKRDGRITAALAVLRYQDGAFPGIWGMLGGMISEGALQEVAEPVFPVLAGGDVVAVEKGVELRQCPAEGDAAPPRAQHAVDTSLAPYTLSGLPT